MLYDVVIIWAWASGLFAGISLDKNLKKLILEKTDKPGTKVLLSWGERANVTNMNVDTEDSYFSQNKKFLKSVFSKYNHWDFINFCAENWLELVEEDRGRLILKSWNSRDLMDLFLRKIRNNNCELKLKSEVLKIDKVDDIFEIELVNKTIYKAKNIIVSSGWKSFFQVWTTWDWYNFASDFWMKIVPTLPWLCWITTKRDLWELSWSSSIVEINLIDKATKKIIYNETGPILFTHFGLSWPIIFNTSIAIGEYLSWIQWDTDKYISDNLCIEIRFDSENITKKIAKFFELEFLSKNNLLDSLEKHKDDNLVNLDLHTLRSLKEAKVTTWGIDLDELDNHMQSKKQKWLFFIWEVVDVTGKTWGFNLQWAWSSGFVVAEWINKIT